MSGLKTIAAQNTNSPYVGDGDNYVYLNVCVNKFTYECLYMHVSVCLSVYNYTHNVHASVV